MQNKARRKAVRKERRERQRRVVMRAVYDGLEPDDAGRWAIQRILQVERPATSRRGRPLQVLVQWVGDDEDGNPWQDSWVGITIGLPRISEQKHDASRRQDMRPRTWERKHGRRSSHRDELSSRRTRTRSSGRYGLEIGSERGRV